MKEDWARLIVVAIDDKTLWFRKLVLRGVFHLAPAFKQFFSFSSFHIPYFHVRL